MYKEIYLDNSATTRPFDDVIDYMDNINRNFFGNPSSLHKKGIEAERLVKKAREAIADSLGVSGKEVYFTSGGTESNNLAIRGYLEANPRKGRHLITTKTEHPSVLEVFKYLEGQGYKVDYIDVDRTGQMDLDMLRNKISQETSLISFILVNNETGTIQPLDEVIKIRNSVNKGAALHVDAVQAYGKIRLLPKRMGIDMLSVSSHKIHGPKGVGAVYASSNIKIKPILYGGGQEALVRSGTENVAGIAGFGMAAEIVCRSIESNGEKAAKLKNLFMEKLKTGIYHYRIVTPEESSPYILNVSFGNLRSEVLLHHLEERNVYVSTGSACSSRKNIHSHVLKAMRMEACEIEGSIRFSFSAYSNSEEDINAAIEALNDIVPRIQIYKSRK